MFQNYPNPFNPYTTIHYELSSPGFVSLKIIDINGKIICTLVAKYQSANGYKIVFDPAELYKENGITPEIVKLLETALKKVLQKKKNAEEDRSKTNTISFDF